MADEVDNAPVDYSSFPLIELEYESQFFGFSPKALLDTLGGCLRDEDCLKDSLNETFSEMGIPVNEDTLERALQAADSNTVHFDNFDKLELSDYKNELQIRIANAKMELKKLQKLKEIHDGVKQ